MSWSLQVSNGDLVTSGAQLATVTRESKLVQDLRLWLLEKMGTDSLHPSHGSLIDGGTLPNGAQVEGVIGKTDIDLVMLEIRQEINRIAQEYQGRQLARARQDKLTLGRATLLAGEVLLDVTDISFRQSQDHLQVIVTLLTGSGGRVDLEVPLSSEATSVLQNLV